VGLRDLPRQPRRLPKLLPAGYSAGTAEDALDTACGLYLADPHRVDLNPDELTPTTTSW